MSPDQGLTPHEREAMARARALAWEAKGNTSPNPPVGAVILSAEGSIVGQGFTQPPGGAHAEVVALAEAGGRARGGTAVVTLEPCAHTGRTGPCAVALQQAGISRVIYACPDPTPQAHGGHQMLESAGITVIGHAEEELAAQGALATWLHYARTGRAHVTLKVAATLDGYIAAKDHTSQWITGSQARQDVHRDRALRDAIVIGTGTLVADNPRLTARRPDGELYAHQPARVVMGHRQVPHDAAINDGPGEVLHLDTHDFSEAVIELTRRGFVDVLIEGGPTLAGAAISADCVDALRWYVAPTILGAGISAVSPVSRSLFTTLEDRLDFQISSLDRLGADVLITAQRVRGQTVAT